MGSNRRESRSARWIGAILSIGLLAGCPYVKMRPAPDADKASLPGNNSCWLATASNMLAGAGYGNGATVQARATDIYGDMTAHYGTADGGWIDTALSWWLGSAHNVWPANPYDLVTVSGNKTKIPWTDPSGPMTIGNELRSCHFVGLSVSWPRTTATGSASGGHAITAWGDPNFVYTSITANPTAVTVTDSDRDTGGDRQSYTYDAYSSPNPGGFNEGNGWYVNYGGNHPFIKHIAVLSPVTSGGAAGGIQIVRGQMTITQAAIGGATGLRYTVGTDVDILSYRTWLNLAAPADPTIAEASPRRSIDVTWDLQAKPVAPGASVVITTEFVLASWNAMEYSRVEFTSADGKRVELPPVRWEVETPRIPDADKIRNVTGGYVVGAFDLLLPDARGELKPAAEYHFVHQYGYNQSPERHVLRVKGAKWTVANPRIGHAYGLPDKKELGAFRGWMSRSEARQALDAGALEVPIDWGGRLPYPEADIVPWIKTGKP